MISENTMLYDLLKMLYIHSAKKKHSKLNCHHLILLRFFFGTVYLLMHRITDAPISNSHFQYQFWCRILSISRYRLPRQYCRYQILHVFSDWYCNRYCQYRYWPSATNADTPILALILPIPIPGIGASLLPANIRKWLFSRIKTWRNDKFHGFHV